LFIDNSQYSIDNRKSGERGRTWLSGPQGRKKARKNAQNTQKHEKIRQFAGRWPKRLPQPPAPKGQDGGLAMTLLALCLCALPMA